MSNTDAERVQEEELVAQKVCAWCSARVGEMNVELRRNGAAHHEGWYFCSEDCLREWLDDE